MRVDVGVVTTYICMCACVFHLSCSLTLSVRDNCSTVTAVVTLLQFWSLPLSCFVAVIKGCLSKPSSLGAGCGGTRIERKRNMMSMAFIDGHLRNICPDMCRMLIHPPAGGDSAIGFTKSSSLGDMTTPCFGGCLKTRYSIPSQGPFKVYLIFPIL